MDTKEPRAHDGSLQISSGVIERIAKLAAQEVEGVDHVAAGGGGDKGLIGKLSQQKPIRVEPKDDVADIEISLVVKYGTKIPELSERVQQNVKQSVQNMTSIIVGRVDIIVTGVTPPNGAHMSQP